MINLGRMGFSPDEIDSAISSVMDLAKATGSELGRSAEIAGINLRVFNLEAGEMAHVADLLSVTANDSAQTLDQLGEALVKAGPKASNMGESIEDTLGSLGVLANLGLRGAYAGNLLGRMLDKLSTSKAQSFLQSFNIATTTADGNLRKLKDMRNMSLCQTNW